MPLLSLLRHRVAPFFLIMTTASAMAADPSQTRQPEPMRSLSVEQENAFTFRLFNALPSAGGEGGIENAILCPGGVSRLLRALEFGARGATADEIAKTLDLGPTTRMAAPPLPPADVLKIASGIWCDPAHPFLPSYEQGVKKSLGASATIVPLVKEPETARKTINTWASDHTGGNIPELLKPGALDGAILVLTDAAWFKDSWLKQFDPKRSVVEKWTKSDGTAGEAKYVADTRNAKAGRTDAGEVLSLPFASPRYEFLCILPAMKAGETPGAALRRLEKDLKPETLKAFDAVLVDRPRVDIRLPKLNLKGLSTNLIPPLQALGITTAFSERADFSGMTKIGSDLEVGVFKQDTLFRLDETGAEAVAVTVAVMMRAMAIPGEPVPFHADRPCLMVIRDTETKEIIFLIRCAVPESN